MGSKHQTVLSQRLLPLTVAGLIVGVPVATWGLISPGEFPYQDPDYMVQLDLSPDARLLTGVIAAVVVVGVLVPVVLAFRSGATVGWWARVVVPLIASGLLTGWTVHFASAPAIGANIGGGLMVMLVLPMALALLMWGLFSAMRPPPKARE